MKLKDLEAEGTKMNQASEKTEFLTLVKQSGVKMKTNTPSSLKTGIDTFGELEILFFGCF